MILKRHKRTTGWVLGIGAVAAALHFIEVENRVAGTFEVRSAVRVELRAPAAGFLREIYCDQGGFVSPGAPVVRLEIPDLESRLACKWAEVNEAEAKLRLLKTGPRAEEIADQRSRIERAIRWRDLLPPRNIAG